VGKERRTRNEAQRTFNFPQYALYGSRTTFTEVGDVNDSNSDEYNQMNELELENIRDHENNVQRSHTTTNNNTNNKN